MKRDNLLLLFLSTTNLLRCGALELDNNAIGSDTFFFCFEAYKIKYSLQSWIQHVKSF
jgi:hypothetical protein